MGMDACLSSPVAGRDGVGRVGLVLGRWLESLSLALVVGIDCLKLRAVIKE